MSYKVSNQSGMPSGFDHYSIGSENTVKQMIPTPPGFNNMADSAIVNMHQDSNETKPIGVPGTTYTPHKSDNIYRTEGGHIIIYGNAPGSETLRIQSKSGATIELDSDGAIKMVSGKGIHMSIGGDNQIVLQGDFAVSTNGDFSVKCGTYRVECTDYHVNAWGSMLYNVHGDYNLNAYGDAHSVVTGDHSLMAGGDDRHTVGGDYTSKITGDMTYSSKGKSKIESIDDMVISTKGKNDTTSTGDMTVKTKAKMVVSSEGEMSTTSKGDMTTATQGKMTNSSKGEMSVASDGEMKIGSQGTTSVTSGGTTSVTGPTLNLGGNINVGGGSVTGILDSDGNESVSGTAGVSIESAPDVNDAEVEIPEVEIIVADLEDILDLVSDWVATDGEIVKITSAQQLAEKYSLDEDGELPPKVRARAEELGIMGLNDEPYQDALINSVENSSGRNNITIANDGSSFHTYG